MVVMIIIFNLFQDESFAQKYDNPKPSDCLTKEEKNALDRFMSDHRNYVYTQLPIFIQDPIYDGYKELKKFPLCPFVKDKKWTETFTGKMVKNKKEIDRLNEVSGNKKTKASVDLDDFFGNSVFRDILFKKYVLPFPEYLQFNENLDESTKTQYYTPVYEHTGDKKTSHDRMTEYKSTNKKLNELEFEKKINKKKSTSGTNKQNESDCSGDSLCAIEIITNIIDADTIYTKNFKIRLSLINTPEKGDPSYDDAKSFTASLCPLKSTIRIDQDDKQPYDAYGRLVGKAYCSGRILNSELLEKGYASIQTKYCNKSEFASDSWAKKFGCS